MWENRNGPEKRANAIRGLTHSLDRDKEGLAVNATTRTCSIEGCDKPTSSRGLCANHYAYLRHRGQLPPRSTYPERFWAKVDKSGECWKWTGCITPKGYGSFKGPSRTWHAHRYAYTLHHGSIPEGLMVDHMCHNRACVNPNHLRAVTPKQNEENRAGANKNSMSGIRGVSWSRQFDKWVAQVHHNGRSYFAGYFDCIEPAEAAVIAKRNELFTHNDLDRIGA